jgi:hypothetical protein
MSTGIQDYHQQSSCAPSKIIFKTGFSQLYNKTTTIIQSFRHSHKKKKNSAGATPQIRPNKNKNKAPHLREDLSVWTMRRANTQPPKV